MKKEKINKIISGETLQEEIKLIETETTEVVKESTIFDTYRKYINMANSNYIHDLSYADGMKMLRYIESKTNHNVSMNFSCPSCIINLVQMFSRLENK